MELDFVKDASVASFARILYNVCGYWKPKMLFSSVQFHTLPDTRSPTLRRRTIVNTAYYKQPRKKPNVRVMWIMVERQSDTQNRRHACGNREREGERCRPYAGRDLSCSANRRCRRSSTGKRRATTVKATRRTLGSATRLSRSSRPSASAWSRLPGDCLPLGIAVVEDCFTVAREFALCPCNSVLRCVHERA